jgi:hypothetical protein
MQLIYPLKTMDNIPEDISLGNVIKYMNYTNKLSEGVIQRILRPDILFVKDTKTQYEEKIYKSNIVINLTILEKSILDKLSEIHNFYHNTKIINIINDNTVKIIEILEFRNTMYLLFYILMILIFIIFYSIYPTEFNNFGLIFYNSSMIYYNKIQTYLISQFVEYKKVINNYHNNSYDDYDF